MFEQYGHSFAIPTSNPTPEVRHFFAYLCVLCGKKGFNAINRKEREGRKDRAKS
jgi:hypothetical protein